jgi:hypothetical protein
MLFKKTPILHHIYDVQHSATHFSHRLVFKVASHYRTAFAIFFRVSDLFVYELIVSVLYDS